MPYPEAVPFHARTFRNKPVYNDNLNYPKHVLLQFAPTIGRWFEEI